MPHAHTPAPRARDGARPGLTGGLAPRPWNGARPGLTGGLASRARDGARPGLTGAVGRACYRHRWLTLIAWLACLVVLVFGWMRFGAAADNSFTGTDPGQAILARHFHTASGDRLTLAIRSRAPIRSPAERARFTAALAPFRDAAGVTGVTSPYQVPGQISRNGHIAFATVQFARQGSQIPSSEVLALMHDARAASGHGSTFSLGGDVVDQAETPYGGRSEGIGVAAAAVVLLTAFGSLLAMGLPIVTALFGIGTGLALIALLGHLFPAPSFSPVIASMIGLGVGVDYALFIVTRFREGLRAGQPPVEAATAAMSTAGRSVTIAGTTVVIGMLGLLVLRQPLLNGVAVAAAATVAMTVAAALTLLPALLSFTGTGLARRPRIRVPGLLARRDRRRGLRRASGTVAQRWAAIVQARPKTMALAAAAVIIALAAPALGMKLSMPDESAQARTTMGYASYHTMAAGFGPGFDAPLIVAATLPSPHTSTAGLAHAVARTPGVAAVTPVRVSADGKAAMLIAYPATGEQDPATNALVNRIEGTVLPRATAGTGIRAYLTGPSAGNVAFANAMGRRLPWLIGIVVALSMVLLTAVFRSVVVAVKAAVMNLLSISAAYGVLVLVAQHGVGASLFGFGETMPVTTWVPVFLFVILFGLSMDYEVFLLSRIREDYDATGDNAGAVARGLASTARVISAAAAIMIVVFWSFVLGADVSVKQIGLGLAAAILVDATIVRLVLVPAAMELLGNANWWLPGPLARILPAPAGRPEPSGAVLGGGEPEAAVPAPAR
jgi:uncharacterized membrane protein YdfJ with MMPL/SSD domain